MLVFAPGASDAFPDDTDTARRWRLPATLEPLAAPDGAPEVLVGRSPDGGVLHLRLAARWPQSMQTDERPVPIAAGRFRLLLQGPAGRETGQWWPAASSGNAVVDRSVALAATEAAIARKLAERGGEVVEVEVELAYEGYAPVWPWIASTSAATLRERVAGLLGQTPASWDEVEAAFLGLAEDSFDWVALVPAAIRPPRDDALRALAFHTAPLLLERNAQGAWTVAAGMAQERVAVDLRVPLVQARRVVLRWSLSAFLDSLGDRTRHLVDLTLPAPLEAAPLALVNDLTLAGGGLSSLVVEVRTGGPSGVLAHEFRPGEPGAVQLRFVRRSFDEAPALQWRAHYTVATADGPVVGSSDWRPGTQFIELNSATLGLKVLRVAADAALFAHVAMLEVKVGARTLQLTAAAPQAWAVGRQPPATAAVTAVLGSAERVALGNVAPADSGVTLGIGWLGIGAPQPVALRAPADLPQRAAYLAVQVEGYGWRSVDPGTAVTLVLRRPNRWHAPALRYRTRHVPRGADGRTAPVVESAWRDARAESIEIVF